MIKKKDFKTMDLLVCPIHSCGLAKIDGNFVCPICYEEASEEDE